MQQIMFLTYHLKMKKMSIKTIFSRNLNLGFTLLSISLFLFSCSKNSPPAGPTPGPLAFNARAGGYQRSFSIASVTYTGNILTMNLVYKGKPDTCSITIVLTAQQYGNFTLASKSSPNYAYMDIHDHLADTVYYTDNTHLGNIQLTQFITTPGNHLVEGNFSFICNETSPMAGGGVDTAKGSFTGITW
jgi:hypothetical protein